MIAEARRRHPLILEGTRLVEGSRYRGVDAGALREGPVRIWRQDDSLVCEVRARGRIADPLVGRNRPGRLHMRLAGSCPRG